MARRKKKSYKTIFDKCMTPEFVAMLQSQGNPPMPALNPTDPPQYLEGWHPVVGWLRGRFVSMKFPRTDEEAYETFRRTGCTNSPTIKLDCGMAGPLTFTNVRGRIQLPNGSYFDFVEQPIPHEPLLNSFNPYQMDYILTQPDEAPVTIFPFADFAPIWHNVPGNGFAYPSYFPQESKKEEEITDLSVFAEMLKTGLDGANSISPRRFDGEGKFSEN